VCAPLLSLSLRLIAVVVKRAANQCKYLICTTDSVTRNRLCTRLSTEIVDGTRTIVLTFDNFNRKSGSCAPVIASVHDAACRLLTSFRAMANTKSRATMRAATKPPRFFAAAADFRKWLSKHAAASKELIVGFHKVASGKPCMSWSESVDEALSYGWIDGVRKRIDDKSYQIRFTPRKPDSIWSAINIAKVQALHSQGRMTEAGIAAHARRTAKKSVVYSYEQDRESQLSASEIVEFKRTGHAWQFLRDTPPSYRKVVLHWVVRAKKPETRASRFRKLLSACETGIRLR
jgi:uncharacterized protein YdeI (YjbR/CyaY-like superfamily)